MARRMPTTAIEMKIKAEGNEDEKEDNCNEAA